MADLPPLALRLNKAAIFDSFGNLAPGNIPGGGVNISAAMIPVVTAPDSFHWPELQWGLRRSTHLTSLRCAYGSDANQLST